MPLGVADTGTAKQATQPMANARGAPRNLPGDPQSAIARRATPAEGEDSGQKAPNSKEVKQEKRADEALYVSRKRGRKQPRARANAAGMRAQTGEHSSSNTAPQLTEVPAAGRTGKGMTGKAGRNGQSPGLHISKPANRNRKIA